MAPSPTMSKGLEEKIVGLLAQLAVTNESVMNLAKISEKHETVIYGNDENGGLISRNNVVKQTLADHAIVLDRLEKSCQSVTEFMQQQVQVNKSQQVTNATLNRVLYGLAGLVFLILLLIGVADISALHSILGGVHIP